MDNNDIKFAIAFIVFAVVLGVLTVCMSLMHLIPVNDPFKGNGWLGFIGWKNKHIHPILQYFPFIMFTDLFHFCHGVFGLVLGGLISPTIDILDWNYYAKSLLVSLVYSILFEISLRIFRKK